MMTQFTATDNNLESTVREELAWTQHL